MNTSIVQTYMHVYMYVCVCVCLFFGEYYVFWFARQCWHGGVLCVVGAMENK
jgi:hypothetical protein